jgi:hypothetical protein
MVRLVTLVTALWIGAASHSAQSVPPVDSTQLEAFLTELQRASRVDDRAAIAALIRYPITVSISGLRVPFADAASLLSRYDDIFTPALRDTIARREMTTTPQTFVIGTGELVIAPVNGKFQILSITVPNRAAESAAVMPSDNVSPGAAGKQEPRRVAIRVGPRATQIPGLLARDAIDAFILYLPKGRLAGVRLERAPAGTAVIRVVHTRTGAPLGARTSADGRFVSGRPAEGADYRIEVRRTANEDDVPLPYMLSLTLR